MNANGSTFASANHNLWPHHEHKGLTVPPFSPPECYTALETEAFNPRSDDIFISTFPKCGTTWLQVLVYNVVGCPNGPIVTLEEQVPWIQTVFQGLDAIEQMKGPRVFKTHDYWSWLPEKIRGSARFIYCTRNPKDQAVSYYHHIKTFGNKYGDIVGKLSFDEYFEQVYTKKGVADFGLWEDHVLEWMEQGSRDNILFLTFEDLIEDTERELRKIVSFLGLHVDEERIAHALQQGAFDNMKKSDSVNQSRFSGNKDFIRKGKVGGWVDVLNERQNEYLDTAIKRVVDAGGRVRCTL